MTGIAATIELDDAPIRALFASLMYFPDQLPYAADEIGEAMVSSTQRRFGTEKSPEGTPWKQSQRARRDGGKTLQESRRLYRSVVSRVLTAAQTTGVEWGTNVIYAAIHQMGGKIQKYAQSRPIFRKVKAGEIQPGFVKRRHSNFESWHGQGEHSITIPARPFIGIDTADRDEISSILVSWLNKALIAGIPGAAR